MRNAAHSLLVASCAVALSACAPGPIPPATTRATGEAASAPGRVGGVEFEAAPLVDDAVALRWAIAWWTHSRSRAQRLAAVREWSTNELNFELASARDTTSSGACTRVFDARAYRDETGGGVTVTALCASPAVSAARVLDFRIVVQAGRSLVDEVQ
jgi:hypothetical protein